MPLTGNVTIVRWSKTIAILLFLIINATNLILAFTTRIPQIVLVLLLFVSVVPYLIHLHVITKRLG
jgi:hypothetical protein